MSESNKIGSQKSWHSTLKATCSRIYLWGPLEWGFYTSYHRVGLLTCIWTAERWRYSIQEQRVSNSDTVGPHSLSLGTTVPIFRAFGDVNRKYNVFMDHLLFFCHYLFTFWQNGWMLNCIVALPVCNNVASVTGLHWWWSSGEAIQIYKYGRHGGELGV